ncbi:MAG: hypothetical protein HKL80_08295, partial [Acidimicrobiales bacterium]|nr:hypothetical protein [Acidimicrobiales bacterium]
VLLDSSAIEKAIEKATSKEFRTLAKSDRFHFGTGQSGEQIANILMTINLYNLLNKSFVDKFEGLNG